MLGRPYKHTHGWFEYQNVADPNCCELRSIASLPDEKDRDEAYQYLYM